MAGDDDSKIQTIINLDTDEFISKILDAQNSIKGLGDSENISGLVEGLTKMSTYVGALGVTFLTLKTIMDSVFETEKIEKINQEFEILTKNAGIIGSELKEGLLGASGGMVSEINLLQAANKAVVEMGGSASKLPQIMDLARKATLVMGGDLLQNFEGLNQAIATGNQRQLKHMGIIVDVQKAYKDYAASLGVAVDTLSEAGKKQALLEAVLVKGKTAFQGINTETVNATIAWQQLKVVISQVMEAFEQALGSRFGQMVTNNIVAIKNLGEATRDWLVDKFGKGADQSHAHMNRLNKEFTELNNKLKELDTTGQTFFNGTYVKKGTQEADSAAAAIKGRMDQISKSIGETNKQIEAQVEKTKQLETAAKGSGPSESPVDNQKRAKEEAKFQQEMLRLKEDRLKKDMELTNNLDQYDKLASQQKVITAQQTEAKIQEIRNSDALSERQKGQVIAAEREALARKQLEQDLQAQQHKEQMVQKQIALEDNEDKFDILLEQKKALRQKQFDAQRLMVEQDYQNQLKQIDLRRDLDQNQKEQAKLQQKRLRDQQEVQLERQKNLQLKQVDDQAETEREQVINRSIQHEDNAAVQFARGWANGSRQAANSLKDFAAQGQQVFSIMTTQMGNAFVQLGEGSKKGSDVMKDALFGMMADVCQYYGAMMLAAGLFPPNPVVLAGGAGLLVLSGYLRSQASGHVSSAGGGVATYSDSGMGTMGGVPSSLAQSNTMQNTQKAQNSVSVNIQGSVFDSDSTRTRIADLVRQSQDATSFSIQKIGGGV